MFFPSITIQTATIEIQTLFITIVRAVFLITVTAAMLKTTEASGPMITLTPEVQQV